MPVTASDARHGPLTTSVIIEAALAIVSDVGVDGLTMRGLADRLGVSPAAAYKHIPAKSWLLQTAANQLFSRIEEVDSDVDEWRDRVRRILIRTYEVMSRYRGMSAFVGLEPEEIPRRDIAARMRSILIEAGFAAEQAEDIMGTFTIYTSGALDGPLSKVDIGDTTADMQRGLYERGLDRLLDGVQVELERVKRPAP